MYSLLAVVFTSIDLIAGLLGELFASHFEGFRLLSYGEVLLVPLATILVSGLLWFYHNRIKIEESATVPEVGGLAEIQRIYLLTFSGVGLTILLSGLYQLITTIPLVWDGNTIITSNMIEFIARAITRLVVGLPVWLNILEESTAFIPGRI